MKHQLKLWLRGAYARLLFHTGLHALVDRMMPRRLTILFGHCLERPDCNGFLPAEMKIRHDSLERILGWFGKRYTLCTIGEGYAAVKAEPGAPRSLVALSLDDGYRDNRTDLLPLLERVGGRATVFLESAPLDEGRVNWSHKFFWLLDAGWSVEELARRYQERSEDSATRERLRVLLEEDADSAYGVKRVLKYDADEADRDRVLQELFAERGGVEADLCAALYMTWEDARALRDAGVELGGHTVRHEILGRLDPARQAEEIDGCRASLERELGRPGPGQEWVFAYPFGRRWDYDGASMAAARAAGFSAAVNTHAGTNDAASDPYQLRRLPIDDSSALHLLVAEACGGFDLLRRVGLDLSE